MLKMGAVVWGVRDIPRAVRFWSEALHYKLREPASEDWAVRLPIEGEGVQLSRSPPRTPAGTTSTCLPTRWSRRWRCPEGADYVVLQDPDGNPFCVVARRAGAVSCGCPPQAQGR